MKKIVLACAVCAAFTVAAPAQELPSLSQFLSGCYRDSTTCRAKLKDYITAADRQNSICRPKDQTITSASGDMLNWLRSGDTHDDSLDSQPYDEGLWAAASALWPCTPPDAAPAPAPEAAPAAPPAEPPAE